MSAIQKTNLYYLVKSSAGERGSGWRLENREKLQPNGGGLKPHIAWPNGPYVLPEGPWSMPAYLEQPRFLCEKRSTNSSYDFDTRDGYFVISERMKSVFEELAPTSCEYQKCITYYKDSEPGPDLWLCTVRQAYRDAVDLQASENVKMVPLGFYKFELFRKPKLAFKTAAVAESHVFRLAESASDLFCDEEFTSRCKIKKIKGISFKKIGFSAPVEARAL